MSRTLPLSGKIPGWVELIVSPLSVQGTTSNQMGGAYTSHRHLTCDYCNIYKKIIKLKENIL